MKTLIKSAKIIDPGGPHHLKKLDLLLEKGKISRIAKNLNSEGAREVSAQNLCVSTGWFDARANFRDPGFEEKEDIHSGLEAAAHGGFTSILIMPSTDPIIDNKSAVEYVLKRAEGHLVSLQVCGSLSKGLKNEQLADIYDMQKAGAIAFGNDKADVNRIELMYRALEYCKNFNGLVFSFPYERGLLPGGAMHEGKQSTELGLKGIPSATESIRLQRDIEILRYTGGRMHVSLVSSKESVELIRKAKKDGISLTCDVSASHLVFNDEALSDFDPNFKVLPPFRTEKDRKALIKGLKDGTIDFIVSDHSPQDIENKQKEFDHAAFGASTIEAVFSACIEAFGSDDEGLSLICSKLSAEPKKILGLPKAHIQEGQKANISLFDPEVKWIFERKSVFSKSVHSPFLGKEMNGKVLGVFREKQRKLFL